MSALTHYLLYVLKLRPLDSDSPNEYSWNWIVQVDRNTLVNLKKILKYVSALTESEELLYCGEMSGTSSNSSHGLWFYSSIQSTEIAKDVHSDPIQDCQGRSVILEEITEEEIYEGYTIASALNFQLLCLSVSIAQSSVE